MGDEFLAHGLDTDPATLRELLRIELHAQRLVAPGAGHFVAAAPGFGERLERFLVSVG